MQHTSPPRGCQVDLQELEPGRFQTIATLKVFALTALDVCHRIATLHQDNPA